MSRRRSRGSRSLRSRLAILGIVGVALPVLILMLLFVATSSDESVSVADDGQEVISVEEGGSDAVPGVVVAAAVGLTIAGSLVAWVWSGRAVRPMAEITKVANEIQGGSLDRRIGLSGAAEEVQALADSFDAMLERLARSSSTQQRLIEDASHELRTPLAALAVNNEVMLREATPTLADYQASARRSEALIERLQLTIDELLLGARTQAHSDQQIDNDLMEIVARVVDQHRVVNPAVPIVVRGPRQLRLGVDGSSMQRALMNLVDNAARYSPDGTPVEIDVAGGSAPQLSVTDHGPGIASDRHDSVFDRYDQGSGAAVGSAGIGLALVKQVAEAHGGIEVVSPLPDGHPGTRFTFTFSPKFVR